MRLIGSKLKLTKFIEEGINSLLKENNEDKKNFILADIFAGSGAVGKFFKEKKFKIISNDLQYYSYITNYHLLKNNHKNMNFDLLFSYLNNEEKYDVLFKQNNKVYKNLKEMIISSNNISKCNGIEELFVLLNKYIQKHKDNYKQHFISSHYAPNGMNNKEYNRTYFTEENANLIDATRNKIEFFKKEELIQEHEYIFLLSSLINSVDKIANTTGVYAAYLKNFKPSALKQFQLQPAEIIEGKDNNEVYNKNCNDLIKDIKGDILYLDPPYNSRQYCDYYHLLETIAKYDNPKIKGKTGIRDENNKKSKYSIKREVKNEFEELIKNAKFKYIVMSYNNEGIIEEAQIKEIFEKYGKYTKYEKIYPRYKSSNIEGQPKTVTEYLYCLTKQ